MNFVERSSTRIYKNTERGTIILSKVEIQGVESSIYYLEEWKDSYMSDSVKLKTRELKDVDLYFELLKDVEGYADYNTADMERKSLFKRNRGY